MKSFLSMFALALLAFSTVNSQLSTLHAQTSYTWNGGGGDWSVAANWTPASGPPGASDTATVNSGTVTVSANTTVATFNLGGGTLNGGAVLTVNTTMNWTAGAMNGLGRTVIAPGTTLNLANGVDVGMSQRALENAGTVLWTGAGSLTCDSGVVLTNRAGALWEVRNNQPFNYPGGAAVSFDNAGIFRKTNSVSTTTFSSGFPFNNYGTVDLQTGTLLCNYPFNNFGTATILSGAVLRLAGGGTASGTFDNQSGGRVDWSGGTYNLNAGVQPYGEGIYTNNATVTVNAAAAIPNFDLTGTLNGSGTLTISNVMNWTAGAMNGLGRTVIAAGATLNLANSGEVGISQWTLENAGTVLGTGVGNLTCNTGSVLTNRAGALWEVRNNQLFNYTGAPGPRFDNAGIFRKTNSVSTTTFVAGFPFNNYGTVDLQTGTLLFNYPFNNFGMATILSGAVLRLAGGGSASGIFDNQSGGRVDWSGGTFSLNAGVQPYGGGIYTNNGTVTVNAAAAIPNFDLTGTLNGSGTLTISNVMNWTAGAMNGLGRTVVAVGATLNQANSGVVNTDQRVLENAGTVLWTGTGDLWCNTGSVLTNRAGALWEVRNNQQFSSVGGAVPRFDNAGTFRKVVGTGTTSFVGGFSFNNYGTVDLSSGFVVFNYGFFPAGSSTIAVPIGGASPGTGFGQMQVSGTVTLAGTLTTTLTNGFYPATNALFTFLTAGTRSGTFSAFNYQSNDVGMKITYTPTSAIIEVINVRPVLDPIADQTNNEVVPFVYTAMAHDDDRPAQTLTFTLTNSPVNASINSNSGQINWTPIEAEGPMTTNLTVRVTDNGTPNLTVSRTFQFVVNEINVPPMLTLPSNTNINELVAFTATATATDSDIPINLLTFALVSGPAGLTVSTNGAINWTPGEDQGPSTNTVLISVTDTNPPAVNAKSLSVTNSFQIIVNEVNTAPVMGSLTNLAVNPGQTITFTAPATDADLPANTLSFSLASPPPLGASINSGSGLFNWRPTVAQANTTNVVQVQVTDSNPFAVNSQHLSDTKSFTVIVNPLAPVILTPLNYTNGQFKFQISGTTGPDYIIMASSSLTNWIDLTTNLSPVTPFQYTDTNAFSFPYLFYRARLSP